MRTLMIAAMIALGGLGVAVPSTAAAGNTIQVNTTADGEFPSDGKCSLAAAIMASNSGALAGFCQTPGTAGPDIIRFNLGTGLAVITLSADLPAITDAVTIDGGGPRVRITGSGSLTIGLDVQATGTTIRDMVIDGFYTGIHVSGTAGATIVGNVIGPNGDAGILAAAGNSNLQIGGVSDLTPGNACDDDCNLIGGNGRVGIEAYGGGTIEGNYIGTDAAGRAANANGTGLLVGGGTWTIGDHNVSARNLISGNTGDGLQTIDCTCTIQGNYIGVQIVGTRALGNGGDGIDLDRPYTTLIGGPGYGTANLISANSGNGINVDTDAVQAGAVLTIFGNRIGIGASDNALGNGGDGVHIGDLAPQTIVGSATILHSGNRIAHNGGAGVRVVGPLQAVEEVRGNSIFANGDRGIVLDAGANDSIAPPVITSMSPLRGTACANCVVDIFSDKADEGRTFQGWVTADANGNWTYTGAVYGPNVTATNTGPNHNTSEFSAPAVANPLQPDGRIRKGSGAFVGNDIYNETGVGQTATGKAARGYTITFGLSLQNDADEADRFLVAASGDATTMYNVKYFRGSTDITAQVVAGTYQTLSLDPGATWLITAKVKVTAGATAGSSVTRLVTITSVGDGAQKDAVMFVVLRK